MAAAGVNLDALIPREDLATLSGPSRGTPTSTIGIGTLGEEFFVTSLRKPDFQRETTNWTPQKIVELVAAFLDGDLIPAIILWRSGQYVFVIDGAHRLSAILAWMYDDYGDKSRSMNFFGGQIPEEQIRLAEQTRSLIASSVGSYADLKDKSRVRNVLSDKVSERLGGLASNSFVVQWVPAVDAEGAERSFFKINQAPTPVDAIEKRILKARFTGNAIAARAINRAGAGHKYWGHFGRDAQEEIEALGKEINEDLYLPPLGGSSIRSSDVPVGGRGYSSLPFVFELVNLVNGLGKGDTTGKDADGSLAVDYLKIVKKRLEQVTTNYPGSVGLHPLVYFYTRGGAFQPVAFLAALQMVGRLVERGQLDEFCRVRRAYESFLLHHKEAFSLIVTSLGSGNRSRPTMELFFETVLQGFWDGKSDDEVANEMSKDSRFRFLTAPAPVRGSGTRGSRGFDASAKSAAFITALQRDGIRCGICRGLLHRNSMTMDHITRKEDGGGNNYQNAQPTHPYCNSGYKERAASRSRAVMPEVSGAD